MRLVELQASNYRNLDGLSFKMSPDTSFIVGENNLGKTNLLRLMNTVLSGSRFSRDDFSNVDNSIGVVVTFELTEEEVGVFGDVFDPSNHLRATFEAHQEDPESDLEVRHVETGVEVSAGSLRQSNFHLYESVTADVRQIDYSSNRGVGRVMAEGLAIHLSQSGSSVLDYFDSDKLVNLSSSLDESVQLLPFMGRFGVHAGVDGDDPATLGSVISLLDQDGRSFRRSGTGLQYTAIAFLQILDFLGRMSQRKLEKSVVTVEDKRILPCILAFDEPETHLHPTMQRALISSLRRVAAGKDVGFNELLRKRFGIDGLSAQLIVATHSPNILSSDYRSFVRLHRGSNGETIVTNGLSFRASKAEENMLVSRFSLISEALFCRCAIVVEGESELLALPGFAKSLGFDLDAGGVVVIHSGSKSSTPNVCRLLRHFGIRTLSIVDRDGDQSIASGDDRTTNEIDFEEELVSAMFSSRTQDAFFEILDAYDGKGRRRAVQESSLKKREEKVKYGIQLQGQIRFDDPVFDDRFQDSKLTRLAMGSWLASAKGGILGGTLGRQLPAAAIPMCYARLIADAIE